MNTLLFLGTAAADFSPRLAGECADRFDRDARRSSSALLNGRYLIDLGEHTLDSLRIARVDQSAVTDLFLTHLHADHCNPEHIAVFAKGREKRLRAWVREDAVTKLPPIENVEWHYMHIGERYPVDEAVSVTGLMANHDQNACPQHFLFELFGKRFLYALDGGWFIHASFAALANARLSLFVVDCTVGDRTGDYRIGEHNSIPMLRLMLPSCRTTHMIDENTRIYASHLAPSLHQTHDETVSILRALGIDVAYDGLTIEF